jgi:S1-C subfamily serine protease
MNRLLPGSRSRHDIGVLRALAPLLVAAVLLVYAGPAAGQGAPREVREASAQVLTLRGYDAAGKQTAQGSGFFFGPGRIATNFHVIAGAERVVVIGIGGDTVAMVTQVEAFDERLDLAILGAPRGRSSGITIETFVPDIGDPIWTYGSPKGLTGTMSDGILSALRQRNGRSVLQITAPISPGSSGGPVLDGRGRVVGVTVSSIVEGQNLNFAVPARELARLAARRAERVPLPVGEARPRRGHQRLHGAGNHADTAGVYRGGRA